MTPKPMTLDQAALAWLRAKQAMTSHPGPFKGAEFARLCSEFRAADRALEEAAARVDEPELEAAE